MSFSRQLAIGFCGLLRLAVGHLAAEEQAYFASPDAAIDVLIEVAGRG
jgi:hypothetical protein